MAWSILKEIEYFCSYGSEQDPSSRGQLWRWREQVRRVPERRLCAHTQGCALLAGGELHWCGGTGRWRHHVQTRSLESTVSFLSGFPGARRGARGAGTVREVAKPVSQESGRVARERGAQSWDLWGIELLVACALLLSRERCQQAHQSIQRIISNQSLAYE